MKHAPVSHQRDQNVGNRGREQGVDHDAGRLERQGGCLQDDLDVGHCIGAWVRLSKAPELRDPVGKPGAVVPVHVILTPHDVGGPQMQAAGLAVRDEHGTALAQPVTELDVLAQNHVEVHPACGVEELAAHRGGRPHVHAHRPGPGPGQILGSSEDHVDPFVAASAHREPAPRAPPSPRPGAVARVTMPTGRHPRRTACDRVRRRSRSGGATAAAPRRGRGAGPCRHRASG